MTTATTTRTEVLISAAELRELLDEGRPVVLLDVRHAPGQPSKRPDYETGHIPGAHWAELTSQLSGPKEALSGNNPLPHPEALQVAVREWGIGDDSLVVVYGEKGSPAPARAWFVLTWAGATNVRFLDGGLAAWTAAGGELSSDEPSIGTGDFTVLPGSRPTLTAEEAAELARRGVLLDARPAEAYAGEPAEAGKPAQGHIPGAVSAPTSGNLDADGLLKSDDQLRERFAALGVTAGTEVGAYCGGGVAAAHEALALASIGITAPVFIGSWSAWSADQTRPVATGTEAG